MTTDLKELQAAQLEKLQQQHKKEVIALELQQDAFQKTGFSCIGYSHSLGIGFYKYSPYVYENGVKTLADIHKIMDCYKPGNDNFVLKFAGKSDEPTQSPFRLTLESIPNCEPTAKLSYKDENGTRISIELPNDCGLFDFKSIPGKHIAFGRYEYLKTLVLKNNCGLKLTRYYGNNSTYTGTAEQFLNLLQINS